MESIQIALLMTVLRAERRNPWLMQVSVLREIEWITKYLMV